MVDRFYIVENEAGELCSEFGSDALFAKKADAEKLARKNSKQFEESYTVATFVRVKELA